MKSRPWIFLCLGVLIGVLLSVAGFAAVQISRGIAAWGALEYITDVEVRKRVREAGIALPAEAHDIHYGTAGFVDSSLWIKFTVPKDKIWELVRVSISKSESDFVPAYPKNLLSSLSQNPNQNYDLSWWTPRSVTAPRSWSKSDAENGMGVFEDWLIDTETGTFYITRWDT